MQRAVFHLHEGDVREEHLIKGSAQGKRRRIAEAADLTAIGMITQIGVRRCAVDWSTSPTPNAVAVSPSLLFPAYVF